MLVRIVKLSIEDSQIAQFKANFEASKNDIRNFEGCQFLELYQEKHNKNLFFTYSYWNSEDDLNNYRHSELFQGVWAQDKTYV